MIKASKLVFISEILENNFASLKPDDPLKKAILRSIKDLKENAFSGIDSYGERFISPELPMGVVKQVFEDPSIVVLFCCYMSTE